MMHRKMKEKEHYLTLQVQGKELPHPAGEHAGVLKRIVTFVQTETEP